MFPEFIYLISEHFFFPLRLSLRKPKEVLISHDEIDGSRYDLDF